MKAEEKIGKIIQIFIDYDNTHISFKIDKKTLEQIREVIRK